MGKPCFICKKEIPSYSIREHHLDDLKEDMKPIPEGMTTDDKICNTCFKSLKTKKVNPNNKYRMFVPVWPLWLSEFAEIQKARLGSLLILMAFGIYTGLHFVLPFPWGFFVGLLITPWPPYYFIKKWTREWNESISENS